MTVEQFSLNCLHLRVTVLQLHSTGPVQHIITERYQNSAARDGHLTLHQHGAIAYKSAINLSLTS